MARSTARRRSSCIATTLSRRDHVLRWHSPALSAKPTRLRGVPDFAEVADRVWVARYEWADANVTAIGSERGVVVVDTHGSTVAGRAVMDDLRRLGAGAVHAVVNTHWHWDHAFGNAAFREQDPDLPIHAHERAAAWLAERGEETKARWLEHPQDPHAAEVAETEIVLPDRL